MPNEISTLLGSCQEFECIVTVDIRNRVGSGRNNDSRVTDNVTIQGDNVGLITEGSLGLIRRLLTPAIALLGNFIWSCRDYFLIIYMLAQMTHSCRLLDIVRTLIKMP
jgi:hypothetical protein